MTPEDLRSGAAASGGRPVDWAWQWGPAVALMAVIFALSSIRNLTTLPGDLSDKSGHFAGYALLGALVLRALARSCWAGVTWPAAFAAWALCLAYGASDELHQWFVPGRTMAFDDWVADAAGAATAIVALRVLASVVRRHRGRTL